MAPKPSPLPPPPPLRLVVDHGALAANWRALDRLSGKARAGAAVKANGYGLGARAVVRTLAEAGCRDFFVAHWQEAAALLDLIDPASISVLHGPATASEAHWAKASGVRPVLNSLEQVARFYHYYDTIYKSCQVDPTQRHMEQEIVRQWMVDLKTRDARWSFIGCLRHKQENK